MFNQTIHDNCERRGHFENGEFVYAFGTKEEALNYCLYPMGCRGPQTKLIAVSFAGTTVVLGVLLRAVLALVAAPLIQTILVRTGLKPTRHSVLVSVTCALVA